MKQSGAGQDLRACVRACVRACGGGGGVCVCVWGGGEVRRGGMGGI